MHSGSLKNRTFGNQRLACIFAGAVWLWSTSAGAQPTPPPEAVPPTAAGNPQPGADDPAARPAARPSASGTPRRPPAPAPRARPLRRQTRDSEPPPTRSKASPVVRAAAGNWGMFFRFGGLASLDHGNNTRNVDGLLLTQVGFRYVVNEKLIIPLYFSLGVRVIQPPDDFMAEDDKSWGMEIGSGIEYHFRIWRRISPFIAFNLGVGMSEPNGGANSAFGIGFGPAMGVEYYIADRVSITIQYMMTLQIETQQTTSGMGETDKWSTVQLNTMAGGAINVAYYF